MPLLAISDYPRGKSHQANVAPDWAIWLDFAGASINACGIGITADASASESLGIYGTRDTVKLCANDGI